ncbi:Telomerase reverse transcriptase [Grifola frondosa]|uniref:Telomerase reverse transcriptase n=1 Tax=Grifola frondosa TaxID=5627 RepID=A0A1C7M6Z5_GRIFR|nr:Telomerase reverse transcriptase [Grifola frondosa]
MEDPGSTKPPVTLSLLNSYFPRVCTLKAYLTEILEPLQDDNTILVIESDSVAYLALLQKSYVAPQQDAKARFKVLPPMSHMRDTIDRAQERLFLNALKRKNKRLVNVITFGYRQASQNGELGKAGMSRVPLTNFFVNTIVTALQAPEWEILLQRIGEDAMFHLLVDTSIFVPLPNDCLCQVAGDSIIELQLPSVLAPRHPDLPDQGCIPPNTRGIKRQPPNCHPDERTSKRLKTGGPFDSVASSVLAHPSNDPAQCQKRTPVDIPLVRARLFYARPYYVPHTNKIIIGLPPKHILNRLHPSYRGKPPMPPGEWVDPDPRKQMDDARHLAKYVFPRQYNLSNPFVLEKSKQRHAFRFPDYLDREQEIKESSCKTPKRLKKVLDMLEKLIWRHTKCGYKALLHTACPSKLTTNNQRGLDSSVILEMMSEHSIQLQTQGTLSDPNASVDSVGRSIVPHGLSQAQRHYKNKPRFAEFACNYAEVYRYAVLVTNAVIPKAFWGCDKNFKVVLRHVKSFISARRFETVTLHAILQGFSTSECEWLALNGAGSLKQRRVSVSDSLKRRELLEEFLFWYFDSFLLPLLKSTFYVTESSAFRNKVLYFRQDDWSTLCAPLVDRLSSETFQRIEQHEAEEILRQRKLGFSFVRLLPKETGVRPIVNLRRRKPISRVSSFISAMAPTRNIDSSGIFKGPFQRPEPSINQILQATFQILTHEKEAQADLLGASAFGPNEVYTKLKAFKSRLAASDPSGKLPKLYFVKVDVQACFDTIEQTKLLEILREAISEDSYLIQQYGLINQVGPKVKRTFAKKAQPEDDHPHFLAFAAQLADALRHTIFVDKVVYSFSKREDIIELLEEHISENIVKIGQDYFRQVVGIPQGSVLSALLCSFFYGDLERRHFKFAQDPQSASDSPRNPDTVSHLPKCIQMLLRLIDDYLLVTTSLPRAGKFLDMMIQGHPEYGCFISVDKTLTNFEHGALMNVIDPRQKGVVYSLSMTTHDITIHVRMSDSRTNLALTDTADLQDSLTVNVGRRACVTFTHKMMQLAKSKSHIIWNDTTLNSVHTVYLNIYQNFMLLAMKMHHYLRSWGLNVPGSFSFILRTIRQMIRYTYATMRNKSTNKVAKAGGGRCDVKEVQILWLGAHAFHTVLSRKPMSYKRILKSLEFELSLPRNRRLRKEFRAVTTEGLTILTLLSF